MSRRADHVVVLDGRDAAMLWAAADLNDLRIRSRSNPALYGLLHDIYSAGLAWHSSVNGSKQQISEEIRDPEDREFATVKEVARRIGRTPRTVRNDITNGLLKATKNGHEWVIKTEAATAYIAGRQPA
jgi:hypothetical protein